MFEKNFKSRLKEIIPPTLFFIGVLIVWETIVLIFKMPEYLLPKPTRIFSLLVLNFNSLLKNTVITILEAIAGWVIANILGFITAVIFAHSKTLEKSLYPYAIALKTTPLIAMAPLLILWFGSGMGSKIVAAAIISFFPILVNTTKGLKTVDNEALDLLRSYSANKWQIFIKLRLPSALPYIFSALKISTGLAIIGAVVGEFVGANKGIGYIILTSSYRFVMCALSGLLFFWLVSLVEKKLIFWQTND
jgi:NitT/TauT family transport system permease protein